MAFSVLSSWLQKPLGYTVKGLLALSHREQQNHGDATQDLENTYLYKNYVAEQQRSGLKQQVITMSINV